MLSYYLSDCAKPFSIRLPVSLWIFPVAVYIVAETELLYLRNTGLGYVIALAFTSLITVLAEEKPAKKVAVATAIVGASLIPLYTLYAPSFGNDTWRDIIWAAQALQAGHVTETACIYLDTTMEVGAANVNTFLGRQLWFILQILNF